MAEETISRHPSGASWITDTDGNPVQHLQYLPYGEPYINQRTTGYNERFTFTGKERDEEGQNFISNYYIISRNQGLSQYYSTGEYWEPLQDNTPTSLLPYRIRK